MTHTHRHGRFWSQSRTLTLDYLKTVSCCCMLFFWFLSIMSECVDEYKDCTRWAPNMCIDNPDWMRSKYDFLKDLRFRWTQSWVHHGSIIDMFLSLLMCSYDGTRLSCVWASNVGPWAHGPDRAVIVVKGATKEIFILGLHTHTHIYIYIYTIYIYIAFIYIAFIYICVCV